MSLENEYERLLANLARIDKSSRTLMKAMYRRELENEQMRNAIINLLARSTSLSEKDRGELIAAIQYNPWEKVKHKMDDLLDNLKLKIGKKSIVGDREVS